MTDEYNGWTNRETWTTALWINNDEGMQGRMTEWAREDKYGDAIRDLFDELWDEFANGEIILAPMFADIGSLWRVNWREIRDSLISE